MRMEFARQMSCLITVDLIIGNDHIRTDLDIDGVSWTAYDLISSGQLKSKCFH